MWELGRLRHVAIISLSAYSGVFTPRIGFTAKVGDRSRLCISVATLTLDSWLGKDKVLLLPRHASNSCGTAQVR